MCLSTLATVDAAEVAEVGGQRWFQLYVLRDEGVTRELVAQAREEGFTALVLTVDAPVRGRRERDLRTGFAHSVRHPDRVARARRADAARGVRADLAVAHLARSRALAAEARLAGARQGRADRGGRAARLRARRGGRSSSRTTAAASSTASPATIDALPEVVDAVDGRVEVLVDGGIRRGTDVVTALALGAARGARRPRAALGARRRRRGRRARRAADPAGGDPERAAAARLPPRRPTSAADRVRPRTTLSA